MYWNFSMWFYESITYFFIYCRNCGPDVLATYFLVPVVYLWIWYRIWYFVVVVPNEEFSKKIFRYVHIYKTNIILRSSLVQWDHACASNFTFNNLNAFLELFRLNIVKGKKFLWKLSLLAICMANYMTSRHHIFLS